MLGKSFRRIIILSVASVLVFFQSCRNKVHDIPFPEDETEYSKPEVIPISFSAPQSIQWQIPGKIEKPIQTRLDPDKFPLKPFQLPEFSPMLKPLPESSFLQKDLPDTLLDLDKLHSQKISFTSAAIGKPLRTKVSSWPHLKNGAHYGLYEYSIENGLLTGGTMNYPNPMMQDSKGFLWMATGNGLIRFDGEYFETYATAQGLHAPPFNSVMMEDNKGQIWAGFSLFKKGFNIIDLNDGIIRNLDLSIVLSSESDRITCALGDSVGRIWIGTNKGLGIIDPRNSTIKFITGRNGLSNDTVTQVLPGDHGQLWIKTNGGMDLLDLNTSRLKHFGGAFGIPKKNINKIFKDRDGNIWIGSDNGIDILSLKNQSIARLSHVQGLSCDSVFDIAETNPGQVWVWTGFKGDINMVDLKERKLMLMSADDKPGILGLLDLVDNQGHIWMLVDGSSICVLNFRDGMLRQKSMKNTGSSSVISSFFEDEEGRIWINSKSGTINYLDKKTNQIKTIDKSSGLPFMSGRVKNMSIGDDQGRVWACADATPGVYIIDLHLKTLTHLTTANGLINDTTFDLFKDRSGRIWMSAWGSGLTLFDPRDGSFKQLTTAQGLSDNSVLATIQDNKEGIWLITTAGIDVLDLKKNELKHLVVSPKQEMHYPFYATKDSMGRIWIQSTEGGVFMIDPDKKTILNFKEKEGLNTVETEGILEKNGNIYVGTNNGLSVISPIKKTGEDRWKVTSLGKPQLLNHIDFDGATLATSNGQLWWAISNDGITLMDATAPDTAILPIYITGIDIGNQPYYFSNENLPDSAYRIKNNIRWDHLEKDWHLPVHLILPYDQNEISFHFTGMHLANIDKTRYRYILEGIDKTWSSISDKPYTDNYRNLQAGEYTIKVTSMGINQIWSKPVSFQFYISPPWWETWWFRTFMGIVFIFILYGIYRWRTASLRKQKRILEQTVKERTAEVVEEKEEVERQKEKSDELLLNILPAEVAEELKEKGYTTAKSFDEVTILFSDIKGFTHVAERMNAQELVKEIDTYFSSFDRIMQQYGLEKIKTIGDAYIAAGGLPDGNTATTEKVIDAAIAMQNAVEDFKKERMEKDLPHFELRIGIHTGPVVAGVVGIKKFQYDIWGDTVNMAARMEQSGVPGKINISQNTYEIIKEKFTCEYRGKVEAKNKGEVNMYFVGMKNL